MLKWLRWRIICWLMSEAEWAGVYVAVAGLKRRAEKGLLRPGIDPRYSQYVYAEAAYRLFHE